MTEIKYAFNTQFFSFKYTFACETFSAEPLISNEEETVAKSACRLQGFPFQNALIKMFQVKAGRELETMSLLINWLCLLYLSKLAKIK